jgi:hypothetical protein
MVAEIRSVDNMSSVNCVLAMSNDSPEVAAKALSHRDNLITARGGQINMSQVGPTVLGSYWNRWCR